MLGEVFFNGLIVTAGAVAVALISFFGGRRSSRAQEHTSITEGAANVVTAYSTLVDDLESQMGEVKKEVACLRESHQRNAKRIDNLERLYASALSYIRRLIAAWPHGTVKIPDPPEDLRDLLD